MFSSKTPLLRKTARQFFLPLRKRIRRPIFSLQNLQSNRECRYAITLKILVFLALEVEVLSL